MAGVHGRLLVVDDEAAVCNLLQVLFETLGYHVELAPCGEAALELVQEQKFDAVISDQDMPGLKGTDFYNRACLLQPSLTGRFIFITGNSLYANAPFPGCVFQKPFKLEALAMAVQELLASTAVCVPAALTPPST